MFKAMLLAGLGGFAGTCLRFLTGKLAHFVAPSALFPWGTFAVNLIGSLLIGLLFGVAENRQMLSPSMSLLLITGFCGGFTTFSTFADDTFLLLQGRNGLHAALYVGASIVLGVLLVWLGRSLIKAA